MKTSSKLTALAALALMALLATSANARSFLATPPSWAADVRSGHAECSVAANAAHAKALAMGVSPDRMQWLYGRKPFSQVGHVSLVIDGWIVVDNGGLGRDLWGAPICQGNVCTLADARRGLDESFLESAAVAAQRTISHDDWTMRVAASGD